MRSTCDCFEGITSVHCGVHVRRLAAISGLASARADDLSDFTSPTDKGSTKHSSTADAFFFHRSGSFLTDLQVRHPAEEMTDQVLVLRELLAATLHKGISLRAVSASGMASTAVTVPDFTTARG